MQSPCPFPPLGLACLQIPVTQDRAEKCHHLPNNRFTTQLERPNLSAAYHYSWMQGQVNRVPGEMKKKVGRRGGGQMCERTHIWLVNSEQLMPRWFTSHQILITDPTRLHDCNAEVKSVLYCFTYAALTHSTRWPTLAGTIKKAKDTECDKKCAWKKYKDEVLSSHRRKERKKEKKYEYERKPQRL